MDGKFVKVMACGFAVMALFAAAVVAEPPQPSKLDRIEDFDFLWSAVNNNYGYFDRKHIDWQKAGRIYRTQAEAARNRQEFIAACEGIDKPFEPDAAGLHHPDDERYDPAVDWRVLDGNVGYLRIRDLGSPGVNTVFDAALAKLADTRGLLLDLRETPRGGNTDVGEHVMGAFLDRETAYQKIIPPNGQSWLNTVIPAPPERRYIKPLIVIVDRWTGSMGEGVAVGLHAAKRATIVGSPMAGLNGEVYDLVMPHSGIGFQFSANKIALPDGTPREQFVPPVLVDPTGPKESDDTDPFVSAALRELRRAG